MKKYFLFQMNFLDYQFLDWLLDPDIGNIRLHYKS